MALDGRTLGEIERGEVGGGLDRAVAWLDTLGKLTPAARKFADQIGAELDRLGAIEARAIEYRADTALVHPSESERAVHLAVVEILDGPDGGA